MFLQHEAHISQSHAHKAMNVVSELMEFDILCSKDKNHQKHPGNQIYNGLIAGSVSRYLQAFSKQDKMDITKEIVAMMKNTYNSRFLRLKGDVWQEITEQMARDKVSHALRFACKSDATSSIKDLNKSHRRRSSSNTTCATNSSATTNSANTQLSEEPEFQDFEWRDVTEKSKEIPFSNVANKLFGRQQTILYQLQETNTKGDLQVTKINNTFTSGDGFFASQDIPEPEFNSIRSEDLKEIMNDPLFSSSEWDNFVEMSVI